MNKPLQELHFQILAEKWKEENKFFSFASEKSKSPYYPRIIAMGKTALPFLLKALEEEPQHWFAALGAIIGKPCSARSPRQYCFNDERLAGMGQDEQNYLSHRLFP